MTDYKPPKEGPYEEFYENGQLERKGTWTRAGRDGLFEQFFPNGQIKYRGMYINGSAEGTHEDYMKEDSLERVVLNYKDNMYNGLYEQFYENGQLERRGNYFEDEEVGEWEYFDENGKKTATLTEDFPDNW